MANNRTRIAIAALSLSAAAFVGRAVHDLLAWLAGSPDWRGQGFLHGPSKVLNSMVDALVRYASDFSPFDGCQLPPVMFKKNYAALIPLLFFRGSPRAVIWRIWSVIVFAINRVSFAWRDTHVCKKVFKRTPSLANKNSAPAIVRIVSARLIFAPLTHHVPSVVLLGAAPVVRPTTLPMFDVGFAGSFLLKTPARLRVSRPKFASSDNALSSARTVTFPSHGSATGVFVGSVFIPVYNKQAAKYPTREINKSWHFVTLKWFTVIGAWQSAVNSFSGATLAKQPNFIGEVA